jgi:hypothetical protein
MTPGRATRGITSDPQEKRWERTKHSEEVTQRKKGLVPFWGEEAHVLPPSMDGTPIDAVQMRMAPKNRESGSKKKRGKGDGE